MQAVKGHSQLTLQLVAGASALIDRYGAVIELMEQDGFKADSRVHMLVEGESPLTMAKSTGLGLLELPTIFDHSFGGFWQHAKFLGLFLKFLGHCAYAKKYLDNQKNLFSE